MPNSPSRPRRRKRPVRLSFRTKVILLLTALAALVFYVQGGLTVYHSRSANAATIAENIATLTALEAAEPADFEALAAEAEAARLAAERDAIIARKGIMVDDLAEEQAKIVATDPSDVSKTDLNRWYSNGNAVIVGDSLAIGASSYSWLDTSLVYAKIGVSVSSATEQIEGAIATNPSVMFMCFGMNDIKAYGSDVDKFIKIYTETLQSIEEQLPNTIIYVNAIFPASASVTASKSYYKYLDTYNQALEEMCESFEGTIFYIDSGFIFKQLPSLYEADGMHAKGKFYALWLTYFADIAGLSNEADSTDIE